MDDSVVQAITIPLFFLGVAVAVAVLLFLYKSRVKKLEALVKIVELGGNVDPEMLKMLGPGAGSSYKTDIRLGMVWLAVGLPVTLGMYIDEGWSAAVCRHSTSPSRAWSCCSWRRWRHSACCCATETRVSHPTSGS